MLSQRTAFRVFLSGRDSQSYSWIFLSSHSPYEFGAPPLVSFSAFLTLRLAAAIRIVFRNSRAAVVLSVFAVQSFDAVSDESRISQYLTPSLPAAFFH